MDDLLLIPAMADYPYILGTPTFTPLANAGATASATGSTGTDADGVIILVPNGAGLTTGAQLLITFGVTRPTGLFRVHLQAFSSAARARLDVGPTSRLTTSWTLTADTVLTAGSTYQWFYNVKQYA